MSISRVTAQNNFSVIRTVVKATGAWVSGSLDWVVHFGVIPATQIYYGSSGQRSGLRS